MSCRFCNHDPCGCRVDYQLIGGNLVPVKTPNTVKVVTSVNGVVSNRDVLVVNLDKVFESINAPDWAYVDDFCFKRCTPCAPQYARK
jgi:hypothetical protein